jgi:hypothetical protein
VASGGKTNGRIFQVFRENVMNELFVVCAIIVLLVMIIVVSNGRKN